MVFVAGHCAQYHPQNDIGLKEGVLGVCAAVDTHFPLIAGILLGGLDEIAPAVKILIVLLLCHVSVLNEHMWQMRL